MTEKEKIIVVYGTSWCPDCHFVRRYLDSKGFVCRFINIESDAEGRAFVLKVNHGNASVPTLLFPDGTTLSEPGLPQLEAKLSALYA